jgi:hypothetical protein
MELLEFRFLVRTQVNMFIHQSHPSHTCHTREPLCKAAPVLGLEQKELQYQKELQ